MTMKSLYQLPVSESKIITKYPPVHKTPHGELSDLWKKYHDGDSSAISALYRLYVHQLYNYGRQFAEHAMVQDCIQDVFYELIRCRQSIKNVYSVKAYLFACLRNRILKQLKKMENQETKDLLRLRGDFEVDFSDALSEDCDSVTQEEASKLNAAFNQLTERQREVLLLFYYEKLSYKELTSVLRLGNINSARILMHRAIQSLRKILRS